MNVQVDSGKATRVPPKMLAAYMKTAKCATSQEAKLTKAVALKDDKQATDFNNKSSVVWLLLDECKVTCDELQLAMNEIFSHMS